MLEVEVEVDIMPVVQEEQAEEGQVVEVAQDLQELQDLEEVEEDILKQEQVEQVV
jgi:hypothetical protein